MRPFAILVLLITAYSKATLANDLTSFQSELSFVDSLITQLKSLADWFGVGTPSDAREWPPEPAPDYRTDPIRSYIPHSVRTSPAPCNYCSQYDYTDNIAQASFETSLCGEPIDVVYTYVNGSDPLHKEALAYWRNRELGIPTTTAPATTLGPTGSAATSSSSFPSPQLSSQSQVEGQNAVSKSDDEVGKATDEDDSTGVNRYRDSEELRYSLRSIARYAPWVRNIYIVTNGQVPSYLNLHHPRVHLITHEMIYPNKSHLPVFASPSIETHLHRIPGLSNRFIYFNDDVMLGAPTYPDDFWSANTGQKVYLSWEVPLCAPKCHHEWLGDGMCDVFCNIPECNYDYGDCTVEALKQQGQEELATGPLTADAARVRAEAEAEQARAAAAARNARRQDEVTSAAGSGSHGDNDGDGDIPPSLRMCHHGCQTQWLGDKMCDRLCNNAACGFDAGDCGTAELPMLPRLALPRVRMADPSSSVSIEAEFHIPVYTSACWVDFRAILGAPGPVGESSSMITSASHDSPRFVRTAAVDNNHKVMVLVLFPDARAVGASEEVKRYGLEGGRAVIEIDMEVWVGKSAEGEWYLGEVDTYARGPPANQDTRNDSNDIDPASTSPAGAGLVDEPRTQGDTSVNAHSSASMDNGVDAPVKKRVLLKLVLIRDSPEDNDGKVRGKTRIKRKVQKKKKKTKNRGKKTQKKGTRKRVGQKVTKEEVTPPGETKTTKSSTHCIHTDTSSSSSRSTSGNGQEASVMQAEAEDENTSVGSGAAQVGADEDVVMLEMGTIVAASGGVGADIGDDARENEEEKEEESSRDEEAEATDVAHQKTIFFSLASHTTTTASSPTPSSSSAAPPRPLPSLSTDWAILRAHLGPLISSRPGSPPISTLPPRAIEDLLQLRDVAGQMVQLLPPRLPQSQGHVGGGKRPHNDTDVSHTRNSGLHASISPVPPQPSSLYDAQAGAPTRHTTHTPLQSNTPANAHIETGVDLNADADAGIGADAVDWLDARLAALSRTRLAPSVPPALLRVHEDKVEVEEEEEEAYAHGSMQPRARTGSRRSQPNERSLSSQETVFPYLSSSSSTSLPSSRSPLAPASSLPSRVSFGSIIDAILRLERTYKHMPSTPSPTSSSSSSTSFSTLTSTSPSSISAFAAAISAHPLFSRLPSAVLRKAMAVVAQQRALRMVLQRQLKREGQVPWHLRDADGYEVSREEEQSLRQASAHQAAGYQAHLADAVGVVAADNIGAGVGAADGDVEGDGMVVDYAIHARNNGIANTDVTNTEVAHDNASDSPRDFPPNVQKLSVRGPGRKPLLDAFGDSLRFVNKLYNEEFGLGATRRMPAHMPHAIDKRVLHELQSKWAPLFEATSSHRFRHGQDVQFAFSYFYFLVHTPPDFDAFTAQSFHDSDWDGDGTLDAVEAVYLLQTLRSGARPLASDIRNITESLCSDVNESYTGVLTGPTGTKTDPVGVQMNEGSVSGIVKSDTHATFPVHSLRLAVDTVPHLDSTSTETKSRGEDVQASTALLTLDFTAKETHPHGTPTVPTSARLNTDTDAVTVKEGVAMETGKGMEIVGRKREVADEKDEALESKGMEEGELVMLDWGETVLREVPEAAEDEDYWSEAREQQRAKREQKMQRLQEMLEQEERDKKAAVHYNERNERKTHLDHSDAKVSVKSRETPSSTPAALQAALEGLYGIVSGNTTTTVNMTHNTANINGEAFSSNPENREIPKFTGFPEITMSVGSGAPVNLTLLAMDMAAATEEQERIEAMRMLTTKLSRCPLTLASVRASTHWQRLIRMALLGATKYQHEMMSEDDIEFYMMPNDFHAVQPHLDHIRRRRPKFICINDDVQGEPDPRVFRALRNFYESYFPKPSPFELPEGQVNPYLHYDELLAHWRRTSESDSAVSFGDSGASAVGGSGGDSTQDTHYLTRHITANDGEQPDSARPPSTAVITSSPTVSVSYPQSHWGSLAHPPIIPHPAHGHHHASHGHRAVPAEFVLWALAVGVGIGVSTAIIVVRLTRTYKLHVD